MSTGDIYLFCVVHSLHVDYIIYVFILPFRGLAFAFQQCSICVLFHVRSWWELQYGKTPVKQGMDNDLT